MRLPRHARHPLLPSRALALLLLTLVIGASCAEEDAITTRPPSEDDMASDMTDPIVDFGGSGGRDLGMMPKPDMPKDLGPDLDVPDAADLGGDGPEEMDLAGEDMRDMRPLTVSYLLCALGQRAPWGECLMEDTLDFGAVPVSTRVDRLARIDNDGETPITVLSAAFTQAEYTVTWLTYDHDVPPASTPVTLPHELMPGESIFAQVSLYGGLMMAQLPETALEIKVNAGGMDAETLSLLLQGRYQGCGANLASCDGDAMNGCEVNISQDVMHCGGCNMPCSLPNASPQCITGGCAIGACDAGFASCDGVMGNGCEVDTTTDMQHCGGCGQVCDYANADEQCMEGSCTFLGCTGSFDNCDGNLSTGCETDTQVSLQHCGGCGQTCDYINANEQCLSGTCTFQSCATNYYNLDGDLSNGCEYFCVKQSNDDAPDPMFVDANCDGIDGDLSVGVFVSPTGNDNDAGTASAPWRTLAKAINVAATTSGVSQIFIDEGNYEEQVFLTGGITLAGGYQQSLGWKRSQFATSRVFWRQVMSKRVVAMTGTNIVQPTLVTRMTIEAQGTTANETSTYGLYCNACTGLTVRDSTIIAGDAGDGVSGAAGSAAAVNNSASGTGKVGQDGSCNGNPSNYGGAGGTSACGRHGGAGGRGGPEGDYDGTRGSTGQLGTPGGAGGTGGDPGRAGSNGQIGSTGGTGSNGAPGSTGSLIGGYWVMQNGGNGTVGSHGNGGGGGGGGGGQGCFLCNNGAGNGGGGGGAGGCGGGGGSGGTGGGSSFGVFLYNSNGIALSNNSIRSGNAGDGGAGGSGAVGSQGMSGGLGATTCTQDVGAGGKGGYGGDGGAGGHGGGGAGGYSYAVWREGTTTGLPGSNILTFGTAGNGGASSGNDGSNGQAATYR